MLYFESLGYGYSKKLCKDVVVWFISKYLPRYTIDITIIHRGLKKEQVLGYCDVLEKTYKPRKFLIELDTNMNKETYIQTLLHELYHLKDFCIGDLKINATKRYYKGECMDCLQYWEQPHEILAHWNEKILYKEYLTERKVLI